ncbi:MAG: tetratricopeptide repeat protein [Alphaproteobacteria bacterium]|nr:tetratricopeptide repeat protein [Alphaproteobacteria bacterium]MCB9695953.1 tetratricopeptide repeat protein [Alphaproteobacteria bacterium]
MELLSAPTAPLILPPALPPAGPPQVVKDERTIPPAAEVRDGLPATPPGWEMRDEPPARPRRRPRRSTAPMMLALAASLALLVLAVPASVVVYQVVRERAATQRPTPVPPREVALAEALGNPPPPLVLPDPPPPEPDDEPEPAPPRTGSTGAALLISEGWRLVETDPQAASRKFRAALDQRPGDAEASYGLGYSLLQLGDREGARPWLCSALGSGNRELHREVQSVLDHKQLTCSP